LQTVEEVLFHGAKLLGRSITGDLPRRPQTTLYHPLPEIKPTGAAFPVSQAHTERDLARVGSDGRPRPVRVEGPCQPGSLWTDGGYNGPDLEALLCQYQIEHIPTNVRDGRPSPARLGSEAFSWETRDEVGVALTVSGPGGQRVEVRDGRKTGRLLANFDRTARETCLLAAQCPTKPLTRRPARVLRVRARQVQVTWLRQRVAQTQGTGNNWRAAVRSTVRNVTRSFGGQAGKLPVRGQIRVSRVLICSALVVNLRRIWRYEQQLVGQKGQEAFVLLHRGWLRLRSLFHVQPVPCFLNFALVLVKAWVGSGESCNEKRSQ